MSCWSWTGRSVHFHDVKPVLHDMPWWTKSCITWDVYMKLWNAGKPWNELAVTIVDFVHAPSISPIFLLFPLENPNLEDIVLAVWALDSSKALKTPLLRFGWCSQEPWKTVQVREVQTVKAQKMSWLNSYISPVLQFFAEELTESWIWAESGVIDPISGEQILQHHYMTIWRVSTLNGPKSRDALKMGWIYFNAL